jgi:hypothetical protein
MGPESFWQLSGAVTGGLVGGLAGFAANLLRIQMERRIQRRNVAAALAAEIEALCEHMTQEYVRRLELMDTSDPHHDPYPYYGFRGEREYMPVFRVMGHSLGALPRSLPRDLIFWYTTLTICLERARDLYELARSEGIESDKHALAMRQVQRNELARMLSAAPDLVAQLHRLPGRAALAQKIHSGPLTSSIASAAHKRGTSA